MSLSACTVLLAIACTGEEQDAARDASIGLLDGERTGREAGGSDTDADAAAGAWDGLYPDVPVGYPPRECIPPCLWELFLDCKIPGAGGGPTGACVQTSDFDTACSACSIACDPATGLLVTRHQVPEHYSNTVTTYYVDAAVCFTEEYLPLLGPTPSLGDQFNLYARYKDAGGRVVADWIGRNYQGWGAIEQAANEPPCWADGDAATGTCRERAPSGVVYCGAHEDPRAIPYELDLGSPLCTDLWRPVMIFSQYSYCALGSCPNPP